MSAADRNLILTVLRDIPDGLGARENIADVLAEKLLVIDRAELPTAGDHPDGWPGLWAEHPDADGTWWKSDILSPHFMRGRAIEILALLEHHAANPPVDEKAVEELALDLIDRPGAQVTHAMAQVIARRLVADGWTKTEATR